jgi:hypothetical protein
MRKILLFCLVVALNAQAQKNLTGIVFNDANNNGTADGGEAGVPGVQVSDQASVVLTDRTGVIRSTRKRGNPS